MKNKRKPELLAPAGSYEAFEAALGAGADAVYVGGPDFGARAYAKNFTQEELISAIHTAHIHGKKLYLTVNTLLKNRELKERLYRSLVSCYEEGLDAVIVQDFGVLRFIRRTFPDLPVHASTQMAVTGPMGMRFLEKLGVARVVPARELSLEELSAMHQASPIEIEAFVHGALCYSISGQCLMSSILGGRSGNRGRCAQPCRLPYGIKDENNRWVKGKNICPLSLKDICTLDLLPKILDAGVISLKIEGRMKQPEYTAGVTGMYRKYLDILENNRETFKVSEEDRKYLLDIFSRGGSCQGYYQQQNGPSMMAFSNQKKTGNVSSELNKRKEKIYGNLTLFAGRPAILELSYKAHEGSREENRGTIGQNAGEISVSASTGEVQPARERPLDESRIRRQMEKLGNTEFCWERLDIHMDRNIFIPVGTLNELRRNAFSSLEEKIQAEYRRKQPVLPSYAPEETKTLHPENLQKFYVSCETLEQAAALGTSRFLTGLYLPFHAMKDCMKEGLYRHKELYLSTPYVTRGKFPEEFLAQAESWLDMGMKGFLVRNLESYGALKERGLQKKCVIDFPLYTWNNEAVAFWDDESVLRTTMPVELNEKELRHRNNSRSEFLVYGYLPLMQSAQCVRKNLLCCDKKESYMILKDRYDKEFSSVCICDPWKTGTTKEKQYCYNILYNSLPYGLLKEHRQVEKLGAGSLRLMFTAEPAKEAVKILEEFAGVYLYGKTPSERVFTKGHFKRGAE